MEFQNANKNEFYGFGNLVICLWKSFGTFLKEFVQTLQYSAACVSMEKNYLKLNNKRLRVFIIISDFSKHLSFLLTSLLGHEIP